MFIESEDKTRLVRQMSQEAINLAMQSRWREAAAVNLSIIENMPTEIDAYNRLGKAYMELSELDKAKEAYDHVLEMAHDNTIALKNLNRISQLKSAKVVTKKKTPKVAPHQFVGEAGKSGVVNLYNLAPIAVLAKITAGDKVNLKVRGQQLMVTSEQGETLGQVEPQHGPRIAKLIEGNNKYIAAIVSVNDDNVKVIIKETYQDPAQKGKLSFPLKPMEGFQAHVKDTLLRHRTAEEEELLEDLEEGEYMGEEAAELLPEGFSILEEGIPAEDVDEEEELMEDD